MEGGAMIRVLLVDDQELVRTGLRGILRNAFGFDVVGECADGSEVLAAVDALAPDVVLMDARMPAVDGVQATAELRDRGGGPPVLALTTFDDEEVLAGMLRAGAAGFVLKGVPAEDLQRAVRVVADGGAWLDPAVTGRVLAIYRSAAPPAARAARDAGLDTLTGRELDVLALIGRGQTNGEIAAALFVGEGTVKTHINHMFTKLRLRDRAAAVVFAYDHGLVRPELAEPGRSREPRSVRRQCLSPVAAVARCRDQPRAAKTQMGRSHQALTPATCTSSAVAARAVMTTAATRQSSPTTKSYQNAPIDLSRFISWSPPQTPGTDARRAARGRFATGAA
jgi:DNA-binding NarL/FixJ family response regulator